MTFFQLVRREMQGSLNRLAVMSGLGGVSNAAILAAINSGAQAAGNGDVSVSSAALFVVALLLFIKTQHYILIATTVEIEAIIHKLRVRLMDEVRHSELLPLDAIGRAAIVAAITKETTTLTQATNMVAFAGQGVVLVFFVGIYIAYLSLLAFAVSVVVICVAGVIFHIKSRQVAAGTREAAEWDNHLFDRLIDLLDGFKEVRLNRSRSDDLFDDVVEVSRKAANIKIRSQSESYKQLVFSQSAMYLLLASVVFMVPAFSDTKGGSITQVTTALMFVVGVCMGIVQTIPILQAADVASDNIERLEAKLRAIVGETQVEPLEPRSRFDKIEMRDVVHDVKPLAADVDDRRVGQAIGPLALVVVAANRRDGRDATQTLENLGRADVTCVDDVIDACERGFSFPAKQSVRVRDDANGLHERTRSVPVHRPASRVQKT